MALLVWKLSRSLSRNDNQLSWSFLTMFPNTFGKSIYTFYLQKAGIRSPLFILVILVVFLKTTWICNSFENYVVRFRFTIYDKLGLQKHPFRGALRKRCSKNMHQIYRWTSMPKYDFNKIAIQLYWNHTSAWLFSCKFAAFFQNIFFYEHPLWACFCIYWYILGAANN